MSVYLGIGDAAHTMSKRYVGIDDQARQVWKMYVGVDEQAWLVYQSGSPIGNLAVGKTVKIAVGGKDHDWLVVHQGLPGSMYDASCYGAWLVLKNISTTSKFGVYNSYKDSTIHSYLNSTFYNLIDSNIRAAIKQVKIPYQNGRGNNGSLATGANGLSVKVFLLSGYEVGLTTSDNSFFPKDGAKLKYFGSSSGGNSSRVAYTGTVPAGWWLRSPGTASSFNFWYVQADGNYGYNSCSGYEGGIRPCMILPQDTLVDETGRVIA